MDGAYMQRSRQAGIRWRTAMECEEGLACMGCGGEGQQREQPGGATFTPRARDKGHTLT